MADVRCVVDTAPLLAWIQGSDRDLGRRARQLLEKIVRAGDVVAVPTVCLFEVAQLEERGKIRLSLSFAEWCDLVAEAPGVRVCVLDREHVAEARALPGLRDPFDRLVAGTSVALGVPLLTPDERIAESGRVDVVW